MIFLAAASPWIYHTLVWENSDPLEIRFLRSQETTDGHRIALMEVRNKSWFPVLIWRGSLEGNLPDGAGNNRIDFSGSYSSNLVHEDNSPRLFGGGATFVTEWYLAEDVPTDGPVNVWMNYVWMPENHTKVVMTDWWLRHNLPDWIARCLPTVNDETRDCRTNTVRMGGNQVSSQSQHP